MSLYDRYTHTPGMIWGNNTGDVACDHYHLYEEDIKIMKEIGIKSYRFSISWPRIFPMVGEPVKRYGFLSQLGYFAGKNKIIPAATLVTGIALSYRISVDGLIRRL